MQWFIACVVVFLAACKAESEWDWVSRQTAQPDHPYTTSFVSAETPISENNVWINGGAVGLDWTNIRTTPSLAFGTQMGAGTYDDSIAILGGRWGPDQSVTATVRTVNQQGGNIYEEVELLLRFRITPHSARGYEINFRALNTNESYSEVVRWNGPLGNYTYLKRNRGMQFGIADGAIVKANIIGNVITVYINDKLVSQVVDDTYGEGNPGIGFFLANAANVNDDFGFTRVTATDER